MFDPVKLQRAESDFDSVGSASVVEMDRSFCLDYFAGLYRALVGVPASEMSAAADTLYGAWGAGKTVMFCGNGGSGSTCSHIVNDLQKNVGLDTGKPMRAMCLSDCVPLVSAWANDTAWANVFAPQVATWGSAGDVLIALSGSGNSANVLNAVDEAKRLGLVTVGLSGFDGGELRSMADVSLHVQTGSMQAAEDAHMVLLHLLFLLLGRRIAEG